MKEKQNLKKIKKILIDQENKKRKKKSDKYQNDNKIKIKYNIIFFILNKIYY